MLSNNQLCPCQLAQVEALQQGDQAEQTALEAAVLRSGKMAHAIECVIGELSVKLLPEERVCKT